MASKTKQKKSSLSSALSNTTKRVELDKITRGSYATSLNQIEHSTDSNTSGIDCQFTSDGVEYCLTASLRKFAMHTSSSQDEPTDGVCYGHDAPVTAPPEVAYSQTGSFNTKAGTPFTIDIGQNLEPNYLVFILFSADHYTYINTISIAGSPIEQVYYKSMGVNGYQKINAYRASGLTGPQTVDVLTRWRIDGYEADTYGQYIVYVIKGAGSNPSISYTDTSFGRQTANTVLAPASQPVGKYKLAIYSYVYFGNYMPTFSDVSSSALTWRIDANKSRATNRPMISSFHAVTNSSGSVQYNMSQPSSGTVYTGAVMFVIN